MADQRVERVYYLNSDLRRHMKVKKLIKLTSNSNFNSSPSFKFSDFDFFCCLFLFSYLI